MEIQRAWSFLNHFGEIQDGATQIQCTPQAPISQWKVTFRLRSVIFNHYDENEVARAIAFPQGPSPQLRAMAHKLRRCIKGQNIDGTCRGCGQRDIPHTDGESIAQGDEEGNNHIIVPPNNPRTHHTEIQHTSTYTFIPPPTADGSSHTASESASETHCYYITSHQCACGNAQNGTPPRNRRKQRKDTMGNVTPSGWIEKTDRISLIETYRAMDEAS